MMNPDRRPPLVLLHGALGSAAQFASLRPLLETQFRVLTLDFDGHGPQAVREGNWRLPHFVENLAALLTTENLDPARIFGYSMGGYAALVLAARQPSLIHSVLTLGTKFVWDEATAAREAARLDPTTLQAKVPAFAQALAARHAAGVGWEAVVRGTAEVLRELGRAPLLNAAVLAGIAGPVRLLVGDRDATVSVEETAVAGRALPAGQLGVLPGTPHPLEQIAPERLAAQITDFFTPAGG